MKKVLFSILFVVFALTMNASTDGKPIPFEQLPANAKSIITQSFDQQLVMLVLQDWNEYEVKLNNGTEFEFDRKGNLKKVDCKQQQVPDALIPAEVLSFVKANYPNSFITEWSKDDRRWKAELNSGFDLIFNKRYQFVGIDD